MTKLLWIESFKLFFVWNSNSDSNIDSIYNGGSYTDGSNSGKSNTDSCNSDSNNSYSIV